MFKVAKTLAACRFLLIVPVFGCVLLTAAAVAMGMGRIFTSGIRLVQAADVSAKAAKTMSLAIIEIIDLFLIGTVAYITAIGLYELFISQSKVELPMRLKIRSLKDLEDKIIGVLVAALAVAFLGHAAGSDEPPETLLGYGGSIALVIAALALFIREPKAKPKANLQSGSAPPSGVEG
jgi:uncharacterized membrane protein YqhA